MNNPTIIAIGFRKFNALNRLLESLNNAFYPENNIKLIISLDGEASSEVIKVAKNFLFLHGEKEVITREERLGLKNHIIWCGNQTILYDSVILLEDDLVVDPWFYFFAKEATYFFYDINEISGISLYSQVYNEYNNTPFRPLQNNSSGYLLQVPSSWGQVWTQQKWSHFIEWYINKTNEYILTSNLIPDEVKKWSSSSWKKYYSLYLAEMNYFFYYPYTAYSTNCADAGGENVVNGSSLYQTYFALRERERPIFNFFAIESNQNIIYDAFLEPRHPSLYQSLGFSKTDIEIDINGLKPLSLLRKKQYTLTSKITEKPIKKYSLTYKPIENNIYYKSPSKNNKLYISIAESTSVGSKLNNNIRYFIDLQLTVKVFYQLISFQIKKLWLK